MERRFDQKEQANQSWGMEEIIRTKLYIPNARENWVSRPRLLERLDASSNFSLTLLVAPAGYGKTTLLSDWIHSRQKRARRAENTSSRLPFNAAWVTLDDRDNDLGRFMTYLAAALETLEIRTDDRFIPGNQFTQDGIEAVLAVLINRIAEAPENFFVVLDDFQAITALPVFNALAFLLNHLPPQMHLILSCRAEPSLALGQLRARGQLLELRAEELRFTALEAGTFLKKTMGLDLPEEAISALEARTEGWIAGLQLAALSLQGRHNALDFIHSFTGSNRYIVEYLAEQVLMLQPEEIQVFLLESSILERLSEQNCKAILGKDGKKTGEFFEYLEKANLFLEPLDDQGQWYRYHPLFADFLRERLQRSDPEHWSELHRRAVEWCESNGWIAEAVEHALAIGNASQAVGLVEQIVETTWMKGEMARLWGWLQALPEEMIRARPRLCIFHAWISNIRGESATRDIRLQEVAASLDRGGLPLEERELILGMQAAVQAIIAIMEGDAASTLELCLRALDHLPEENAVWRCLVYRNLGNAYLLDDEPLAARLAFREACETSLQAGNIYMALISMCELGELDITLGRLRQAEQTFRSALQLAAERGAPGLTITGVLHTGLSEVLLQWNRLEEGLYHARTGIERGVMDGSLGVQLSGYTRLAALSKAVGDAAEADLALNKAMALAPSLRQTAFIAHMDLQGRLWWLQGDLSLTQSWVEESGLHPDGQISCLNEAGYLTLARLLMSQDKLKTASLLLERLRQQAEHAGRRGRLVEVSALLALVYKARGEHENAYAALEECLVLAEPEGYLRIFLDEGEPMRSLLESLRSRVENGDHSSQPNTHETMPAHLPVYLEDILAAFPSPRLFAGDSNGRETQDQDPNLPEYLEIQPLSERELEILKLIAAGLSNQEIARELVVATSTVHWHTKNIYSKLNVHSRTQAALQGRRLGLVS